MCAHRINTICLSVASEEWVGMHYDRLQIQDRISSILVTLMRMWHQKASVLHFLSKFWIYSALDWGPVEWPDKNATSIKEMITHGSLQQLFTEGGLTLCFTDYLFSITLLLSLYPSLSLSYLSLSLINSYYQKNNVVASHILPRAIMLF